MRRLLSLALLVIVLPLGSTSGLEAQTKTMQPIKINLRQLGVHQLTQWSYQRVGDTISRPCTAPSLVHECLVRDGLLPNPWYRDNEASVQWPSSEDWTYRTRIEIADVAIDSSAEDVRHFLEFDGLDTYADVYWDGERIGQSRNMFVPIRIDVTHLLTVGAHELVIQFHSPLRMAHGQYLSNGFNYPADNDHAPIHYSPFTRKAPYHYGWDWGMRMVSMGIWQPVRLVGYRSGRIASCAMQTQITWDKASGQARMARLELSPEVETFASPQGLSLRASLRDARGKLVAEQVQRSEDPHSLTLELRHPKLWWPRGWGEAYLYELELRLERGQGEVLHEYKKQIGIREVRFVNEADSLGTGFHFEVNGRPLFVKGANYVPGELLLTKRNDEDFDRLMQDVAFAQMNMIRVWGGGVYEDERFYRSADRAGVLIWQDFMFACTAYPSDSDFLNNVRQEAIAQVKRLRLHPSIVLWCGNNEVDEALKYWGWQRKFSPEHYQKMQRGYAPLFDTLLREVVATHDPETSYIHSSPMRANWGRPESFGHGDIHYWGLWYGRQPFEIFDERPMRFVSEYGFQSFPAMQSIARFAEPEDYGLETKVMRTHQKASTGNGLIREYMERDYRVPQRFEDFVYVGQVLQARGMEHVMRTLRAHRPYCMGSLYWQLNDAWPAVSWSSVDYFGEYKALHYTTARAYAATTLAVRPVGEDSLAVYLLHDQLTALRDASLELRVCDFSGKILCAAQYPIAEIAENQSQLLMKLSRGMLGLLGEHRDRLLELTLVHKGQRNRLLWYPARTKDLALEPAKLSQRVLRRHKGYAVVELRAQTLVKDLILSTPKLQAVRLSTNCIDLLPGERIRIEVHHPDIMPTSQLELHLQTMNDIHHRP